MDCSSSSSNTVGGNNREATVENKNINGNKNESAENKEQKYDYNCTSHCKNKGSYEKFARCRANNSSCIRYEIRRKSDGTEVGVCRDRYLAKQKAKEQRKINDLKKTQSIGTYNGRNGV